MLKVGTSALAAEIALTHTGALVGDDRLVDAALRQLGIVRVDSIEQLAMTAGLLARTGPLPPGGLGVVSISGGACDIIADRAEAAGVPLEPLAETTRARLSNVLASYGTLRNPLDITGAASANPQIFADALAALADDPSVAVLAAIHVLPTEERARYRPTIEVIASGLRAAGSRGLLVDQTVRDIDPYTAGALEEIGVPHAMTGLRDTVDAVGGAIRWSAWLRRARTARPVADELAVRRRRHAVVGDAQPRAARRERNPRRPVAARRDARGGGRSCARARRRGRAQGRVAGDPAQERHRGRCARPADRRRRGRRVRPGDRRRRARRRRTRRGRARRADAPRRIGADRRRGSRRALGPDARSRPRRRVGARRRRHESQAAAGGRARRPRDARRASRQGAAGRRPRQPARTSIDSSRRSPRSPASPSGSAHGSPRSRSIPLRVDGASVEALDAAVVWS